jgi:hypothetical protein
VEWRRRAALVVFLLQRHQLLDGLLAQHWLNRWVSLTVSRNEN